MQFLRSKLHNTVKLVLVLYCYDIFIIADCHFVLFIKPLKYHCCIMGFIIQDEMLDENDEENNAEDDMVL